MKESTYQKFASVAAFIVALSSLTYGLVFLLLVPTAQKQLAKTPESLTSFAANPTGRQVVSFLLALGGLAATALILATGLPGSAIIGPLFWLWVGYTLWTRQ